MKKHTPAVMAAALSISTLFASGLAQIPAVASVAAQSDLYVSPSGSDSAGGHSVASPLRTIQAALNVAAPGVTIHLAAGTYVENPVTRVNGTAGQPITIEGSDTGLVPGRQQHTIVYGKGHIFSINNSYYTLKGFTINGERGITGGYPGALAAAAAFKDSVQAKVVDSTMIFLGSDDTLRNLTGLVVDDMLLTNAGGDCIRLRNGATGNKILHSTIKWCGMYGKYTTGQRYTYHNGEGVYIGTSPKSTDQSDHADDTSSYNIIDGNVIRTYGSECMDVKENAHDNVFSNNYCADNIEPAADLGSNVELRGYDNTVVNNTIAGSLGYGLKMASDSSTYPQGGNIAENNAFTGDTATAILNNQTTPQGLFCGNTFTSSRLMTGKSVGAYAAECAAS